MFNTINLILKLSFCRRFPLSVMKVSVMMAGALMVLTLLSLPVVHAQQSMSFELPLIINGKAPVGDITASLTIDDNGETSNVSLPLARFNQLIEDHADPEQLEMWTGNKQNETTIDVTVLRSRGMQIDFDPGLLELHATIRRAGTQSIALRERRRPKLEDHMPQASFSSGLSYRIQDQYNHKASGADGQTTGGDPKGFRGIDADVSGFTNIGGFNGWTLFYDVNYNQNSDKKLIREDTTLVKDFYDRGLRLSIGDVRPTVSRFQVAPDLLAISLERDYSSINPFRNLRPSGRSSFTLERDSIVTFVVNGIAVIEEELEPGTYSISDFPLVTGGNDVRVLVDDGTGSSEIASFSTYVDTSLLATGVSNFGVTIGTERLRSGGRQRDYGDDLMALGFFERGISPNLTLGAQAELSENHALISSSAIYGTRKGVFALEAAASKREDHDTGMAATAQYSYRGLSDSKWSYNYNMQANYRSESFISLGESTTRDEEWAWRAGASISRNGKAYSFGGEVKQRGELQTRTLRLSHSRQIAGFSLSLGYQYVDIDGLGGDNRLTLSLLKSFNDSRFRSQYKTDKRELRADWSADPIRSVGQYHSSLSTIMNPSSESLDFRGRYLGSLFEGNIQHRATKPKASDAESIYLSTLTLSGGIGYADGALALGRPFNNGFAIVDRHKTLKGKRVGVQRGALNGDLIGSFKGRSKALVPLSNNYRTELMVFSVDDLPSGYDIGSGQAKFYAGASAGYRVKLGSDAANTVIGKLFWPDGQPLNLASGKVIALKDGAQSIVFTNRTGRFVAEQLRFGKYKLVFGSNDEFSANITVEEGDEPGLVMLGSITLEQE